MKYIEKSFEACEVVAYEEELAENQLDKESLADNSIHPSLQGPDVYDLVKSFSTFKDLKEWMFKEQGGICCYCGCRLEYPNHPQYVVEHVFPKDKNRMLAGEYENFLLSCRPTIEEEQGRMAAPKKEKKSFFIVIRRKSPKYRLLRLCRKIASSSLSMMSLVELWVLMTKHKKMLIL